MEIFYFILGDRVIIGKMLICKRKKKKKKKRKVVEPMTWLLMWLNRSIDYGNVHELGLMEIFYFILCDRVIIGKMLICKRKKKKKKKRKVVGLLTWPLHLLDIYI